MRTTIPIHAAAIGLASALALAGCERDAAGTAQREGATTAQKADSALERTQQSLAAAARKTEKELAEAGEKLRPKLAAAGESISRAADKVTTTVTTGARTTVSTSPPANGTAKGDAAKGAGSTETRTETRTTVTRGDLGDAAITASIKTDYLKDPDLSVLKIDVDTKGGVVTLNGLAENEQARVRAGKIAEAIKGVKEVRNHLTVKRG